MEVGGTNNYTDYSGTKQEAPRKELDKDAFLQILVAQLRNQDPLNPVDGENFIGQMAQLSSLEQLTALNKSIAELSQKQDELRALNLLNKKVVVENYKGQLLAGVIEAVNLGPNPKVLINNEYFSLNAVLEVYDGGVESDQED
ncbi:MAG: hypothetical protein CVU88_03625 [Firmicutes bacterium HGW-Firmicutes-13]|nr:MAG: hypothetical protein CVU88_03625 [Firmicutes bacterium HGW-Firmicutes-13]